MTQARDSNGLVTAWYAGLTVAVIAIASRHCGLGRGSGAATIFAYATFAASVAISGCRAAGERAPIAGLGLLSAVSLAAAVAWRPRMSARTPGGDMTLPTAATAGAPAADNRRSPDQSPCPAELGAELRPAGAGYPPRTRPRVTTWH